MNRFSSSKQNISLTNLKIVLISLVFILGFLVIVSLFPNNSQWETDIDRDLLADHLIAFRGINISVERSKLFQSSQKKDNFDLI